MIISIIIIIYYLSTSNFVVYTLIFSYAWRWIRPRKQ